MMKIKKTIEKLGFKIQSFFPKYELILPYFHYPKLLVQIRIDS